MSCEAVTKCVALGTEAKGGVHLKKEVSTLRFFFIGRFLPGAKTNFSGRGFDQLSTPGRTSPRDCRQAKPSPTLTGSLSLRPDCTSVILILEAKLGMTMKTTISVISVMTMMTMMTMMTSLIIPLILPFDDSL